MGFPVRTAGVVGAGTMGQGIAQVFASGGIQVLLYDSNVEMPRIAKSKIDEGLESQVSKGKLSEEKRIQIIENILPVQNIDDVLANLVIEAVAEDLSVKQSLFEVLEGINSVNSVFCTNTSSLSVTRIFEKCEKQDRCLGVHFFNPAPIMKLVELVAAERTDFNILQSVGGLLKSLGKTTVVSKDSPGFIVNRVARHFYLESLKILEEGVANVENIDALLRSAGFKMGPFELMDLIGIDVNLVVSTAVYNGFNQNSKYKPNEIQINKVKDGHLGRKSGKGFYDYL